MFVINPDPYLMPSYRISPFATSDIAFNACLPDSDIIDDYLYDRFGGQGYIYTENGRKAINIALNSFDLKENDIVTILTTSGNYYISGCVTTEIEKFCKWSREVLPETKVILINHEFGYPYKGLRKLKESNIPIIEDCAVSFFSEDDDKAMGRVGDFTVYSFPKMFPIQIGGLLVSQSVIKEPLADAISPDLLRYVKNVLSESINLKEDIIRQRIVNYNFLRDKFVTLGLEERFELNDGIVPGVFIFRTDNYDFDLSALKVHFWNHGIHSSVFYGEKAFFIPVHQALQVPDLEYFYEVMKLFIQRHRK